VLRRILSGALSALIVVFAFAVCRVSAPAWAEVMQRHGCCSQHCRQAPPAQPSVFVAPMKRDVERPSAIVAVLSSAYARPTLPASIARTAATTTSPPLFEPLETIQLRI